MNLPYHCRDNNPSYTLNKECHECDSTLIVNQNNKHCVDIECIECDYTVYTDNFDMLSEEYNV